MDQPSQPLTAAPMSELLFIQNIFNWATLLVLSVTEVKISVLQDPLQGAQEVLDTLFGWYGTISRANELGLDKRLRAEWDGPKVTMTVDLEEAKDAQTAVKRLVRIFRSSHEPGTPGIKAIVGILKHLVFGQQSITLAIGDGPSMTSEDSDADAESFADLVINRTFVAQQSFKFGYLFKGDPCDASRALRDTRTLLEKILPEEDLCLLNLRVQEGKSMRTIGEEQQSVDLLKAALDTAKKYFPDDKLLYMVQSWAIALIYAGREAEGIKHLLRVANEFAKLGEECNSMVATKWAAYGEYHCGSLPESKQHYTNVMIWAQKNNHQDCEADA
ncbi:hypothetical protein FALBO_13510 [Fusarium albosuccineum]|uniref:Uncharacterized protein n=1 Tax=Fusarium albosuccineum TaxID=1237068 RepID=A0A8H4L1E7_9HYPO|nr:hypothetical protein FALBO_13510 [Fusarium albosuccineum]